MGRKSLIPEIETRIGKPLKQYFKEAVQKALKPEEIQKELGVSKSLVYEFIKDYGVKDELKQALRKKERGGGEFGELQGYLDKYLIEKRNAGIGANSIKKDTQMWRGYTWWLEQTGKPVNLNAVTNYEILIEFENYLRTENNRFGHEFGKAAEIETLKTYRKRMKAFLHWAMNKGIVSDEPKANPYLKMMKLKASEKLPEDMPDGILDKLLKGFGNSFIEKRNKMIIEWFLETGMRLGGVASLKINQFDWEKGEGRIMEKGDKERIILLTDKLKAHLQEYFKLREPLAKCDSLWITNGGEELTYSGIQLMVSSLNDRVKEDIAKLPPGSRLHCHLFRHIWAKHLVMSEVPGFAMMIMAGWANLELVQHYAEAYTKLYPQKAWSYINKASPLSKIG